MQRRRSHSARALLAGLLLSLALAAPAAAESEWCDEGSPPPNDYRLQQTGVTSQVSSFDWLRSIDGGELILSVWRLFGVNLGDLSGTTGGVSTGMDYATTSRYQ